jgi:hypothetical protein
MTKQGEESQLTEVLNLRRGLDVLGWLGEELQLLDAVGPVFARVLVAGSEDVRRRLIALCTHSEASTRCQANKRQV